MISRNGLAAIIASSTMGSLAAVAVEPERREKPKPAPTKPPVEQPPMTRQQRRAAEREALKASPHKRWNQGNRP